APHRGRCRGRGRGGPRGLHLLPRRRPGGRLHPRPRPRRDRADAAGLRPDLDVPARQLLRGRAARLRRRGAGDPRPGRHRALRLRGPRDVAEVAARILRDPAPWANRALELTGPVAVSLAEAALLMTRARGEEYEYVDET